MKIGTNRARLLNRVKEFVANGVPAKAIGCCPSSWCPLLSAPTHPCRAPSPVRDSGARALIKGGVVFLELRQDQASGSSERLDALVRATLETCECAVCVTLAKFTSPQLLQRNGGEFCFDTFPTLDVVLGGQRSPQTRGVPVSDVILLGSCCSALDPHCCRDGTRPSGRHLERDSGTFYHLASPLLRRLVHRCTFGVVLGLGMCHFGTPKFPTCYTHRRNCKNCS